MKLLLKRTALRDTYTIGKLYINGEYFCDTLEDKVRDINKNGKFDNGEQKVYGETSIPYGTYEISMNTISPKYKRVMPRLLNVPNFEGILIHSGNTAKDSHGCILVGFNKVKGKVIESTKTFSILYSKLSKAHQNKEKITITIE